MVSIVVGPWSIAKLLIGQTIGTGKFWNHGLLQVLCTNADNNSKHLPEQYRLLVKKMTFLSF